MNTKKHAPWTVADFEYLQNHASDDAKVLSKALNRPVGEVRSHLISNKPIETPAQPVETLIEQSVAAQVPAQPTEPAHPEKIARRDSGLKYVKSSDPDRENLGVVVMTKVASERGDDVDNNWKRKGASPEFLRNITKAYKE